MFKLFNWYNKFGTIPSSYKEAMSYEEQILWLCKEIEENEGYIEEFRLDIASLKESVEEINGTLDNINDSIGTINGDIDDLEQAIEGIEDSISHLQTTFSTGDGLEMEVVDYPIANIPTLFLTPVDVQTPFLINGQYIDLSSVEVGDILDLTPTTASNTAYFVHGFGVGENLQVIGKFDIAKVNQATNEVITISKNLSYEDFKLPYFVNPDYDYLYVISFSNTDTHEAGVKLYITPEYIWKNLQTKQGILTAGSNISISGGIISATDTTYSSFTGTDGVSAGTPGLVPAPLTTDANKFLSSSGSWVTIPTATTITYGDTDLTAGSSTLTSGEFYFCYE